MSEVGKLYDGCRKHDPAFQYTTPQPPCPHCAADSEILEEKIEATVKAVEGLSDAMTGAQVREARGVLRDALRELVREVRR